jgi:hypothetical protein
MSRARDGTQVWTVADDRPQAADDLRRDWSTQRTPTWAIDTALPDPATLDREHLEALSSSQQAHFAALLRAEKAIAGSAMAGIRLPDRPATLGQAEQALQQARQTRVDLATGSGVWAGTDAARAVRDLAEARANRQQAEWTAEHSARRRERHTGRREAAQWAIREADALARCTAHVVPKIVSLDHEIARHQNSLDHIASRLEHRQAATHAVIHEGLAQREQASRLAHRVAAERNHLDGAPSAADIRRAALRREQLRSAVLAPQHELPGWDPPRIEM